MDIRRLIVILAGLCAWMRIPASEPECAPTKLDEFVARGQDLYFGELHGTVETPALIKCLVLVALRARQEPLFVSLEQEPMRRDPANDLWSGKDGRSSRAMWELTQFLLEKEKQGALTFHQQLAGPMLIQEGDSPPKFDAATYEKNMGAPLRDLAARGQLIALSGNMHSRKERFAGLPYEPAGSYVGPDVLHIDLQSAGSGTAWICLGAGECGVHPIAGGAYGRSPGDLVNGKPAGHDFIYLIPKLTASPPQLPPAP